MNTEIVPSENEGTKMKMRMQGGGGDSVYGLGLIGAWIYYIGRAKTFQEGLMGFFKGIVWPAIVVYKVLELLDKE